MNQVWYCGSCRSLNDVRNKACYACHAKRSDAEMVPDGAAAVGLGTAKVAKDPSLFGALLGGLIAAVISLAAWFYLEQGIMRGQSRLAWLIGVAIGVGVLLGGRGRSSLMSVIFSVLLTIGTVILGEYLIISKSLADAGGTVINGIAVAPPSAVIDALSSFVGDDPLRPLLWFLAIFAAAAIPWRGMVGR
jgi:hypothetical protein